MIVLVPHPTDAERYICVPLRYDRQAGSWVPIKRMGHQLAFTNPRDAILCTHEHARKDWDEIYHKIRVARALSECCDEGISIKGVDLGMVRRELRKLGKRADHFDETFAHLLRQPDIDQQVKIDVSKLVVVDDQDE